MDLINDAVKPWDELNCLLAKPFAYQPDLSDITRLAHSIAVVIKHLADFHKTGRGRTDRASPANKLMSDIADRWKHGGTTTDPTRQNQLAVLSRFEFNEEGEFRFVRNRILIDHATSGKVDFMVTSRDALRHWLAEVRPDLIWPGLLMEGPEIFNREAVLFYDARQQLGMKSSRLETVERGADSKLYPTDCPVVKFVLLDYREDAFQKLGPPIAGLD